MPPTPVPNLLDGLLAWWKLDDYAGPSSVLHDSGPFGHDGHYVSTLGISQSHAVFIPAFDVDDANVINPDACTILDGVLVPPCHGDGSYQQNGWTRSGRAGAITDDFGFYDPASFTFVIFCASSANDETCPGILTDVPASTGFAGGTYVYYGVDPETGAQIGDRVWFQRIFDSRPRMWRASGPDTSVSYDEDGVFSFSLGDTAEDFEDGIWTLDDHWMGCYDDVGEHGYGPYMNFGLAGDHNGFPFNLGWMMYTEWVPHNNPPAAVHPAYSLEPNNPGQCSPLTLWLYSETNGAEQPLKIPMGRISDGKWNMFAVTCDGTTVRTYKNCRQVAYGPAARLSAANNGMGFGFADRNLALSGKDELWQGLISNAIMWDHPLSQTDLCFLFSNWCQPRYSMRSTHRAEPQEHAAASHVDAALHLSNTRFRAQPISPTPDPGSGGTDAHLSDVHFRSAK